MFSSQDAGLLNLPSTCTPASEGAAAGNNDAAPEGGAAVPAVAAADVHDEVKVDGGTVPFDSSADAAQQSGESASTAQPGPCPSLNADGDDELLLAILSSHSGSPGKEEVVAGAGGNNEASAMVVEVKEKIVEKRVIRTRGSKSSSPSSSSSLSSSSSSLATVASSTPSSGAGDVGKDKGTADEVMSDAKDERGGSSTEVEDNCPQQPEPASEARQQRIRNKPAAFKPSFLPETASKAQPKAPAFTVKCWECRRGKHASRKQGVKWCREEEGHRGPDWHLDPRECGVEAQEEAIEFTAKCWDCRCGEHAHLKRSLVRCREELGHTGPDWNDDERNIEVCFGPHPNFLSIAQMMPIVVLVGMDSFLRY